MSRRADLNDLLELLRDAEQRAAAAESAARRRATASKADAADPEPTLEELRALLPPLLRTARQLQAEREALVARLARLEQALGSAPQAREARGPGAAARSEQRPRRNGNWDGWES